MPSSLVATRLHPARASSRKPTNRLGAYLAAGLGATTGITATSDAAIVTIDITNLPGSNANISGVNGGVASGAIRTINNWLGAGTGRLDLYNSYNDGYWGLDGDNGLELAINGGAASPRDFEYSSSIDASATWSALGSRTTFRNYGTSAPDFGPGSFMGFRFGSADNYNYGYLEVTWTSATNEFEILSGAYESVPGVGIITPVPEPSTVALGGVGALVCGGAALRRWRKQKRA